MCCIFSEHVFLRTTLGGCFWNLFKVDNEDSKTTSIDEDIFGHEILLKLKYFRHLPIIAEYLKYGGNINTDLFQRLISDRPT